MTTMPRAVQDILRHGDDLAKRFEDYEPDSDDQRNPDVFVALRRAVVSRSEAADGRFGMEMHVPREDSLLTIRGRGISQVRGDVHKPDGVLRLGSGVNGWSHSRS